MGRPRKNPITELSSDVPHVEDAELTEEEIPVAVEEVAKEEKKTVPSPAPTPLKKDHIPGLAVGRIVHFHKEIPQNNGKNILKPFAAIVTEVIPVPSPANFQLKDGAVNLTVFPPHGSVVEHRHNVRHSEKPEVGKWSFPPKV